MMKKYLTQLRNIFFVSIFWTLILCTAIPTTVNAEEPQFLSEKIWFWINQKNAEGLGIRGGKEGGEDLKDKLISETLKAFINRTLSILSLITLVLLLRGGFQMVTAGDDEGKMKKGTTILKHAAIGLAFIAISWFMVSLIFRVIEKSWAGSPLTPATGTATV